MTYKQAYRAAIRPYILPNDSVELVLLEHGFSLEDEYQVGNEQEFYSSVIDGLLMLVSLEKEKDAGSENQYDTEQLEKRIRFLRRKWDIEDPEADDTAFINLTNEH